MTLITCGWLTPGRRFHVWDTPPRTEPPASTPCLCGAALAPRAKDLPEPPAEPVPAAVKPPPVIRVPVPDGADAAQVLADAAAGMIVEPEPATPAPAEPTWQAQAAELRSQLPEEQPLVITDARIRGVSVDAVPGPAGGRVITQAVDPAPEVTRTGSAVPTARERWFVLALDEKEAQQWSDRQGEGGRHRDAIIVLTDAEPTHPDAGCDRLAEYAITPLDHIVKCRQHGEGAWYDDAITALHLAQERGKR